MRKSTPIDRQPEAAPPDRGCAFAPKCASCPWRVCIQTLPPKKQGEFTAAWTLLRRYLVPEASTAAVKQHSL